MRLTRLVNYLLLNISKFVGIFADIITESCLKTRWYPILFLELSVDDQSRIKLSNFATSQSDKYIAALRGPGNKLYY